jgi:DNA-binding beta-propeller fold protein YncE
MKLAALSCAAAAGLLIGCGSNEQPPPAPEPAASPALTHRPAGCIVEVGTQPEGVAADPRSGLVAVAVRDPALLVLIDGASGRVVRRVPLPAAARHLQVSDRGRLLVPAEEANVLIQVPLGAAGRELTTPVGEFPHDAAAAAGLALVANERADTVTIVEDGRAARTLEAPPGPGGVAAAGGDLFAVVGVGARRLALYDAGVGRQVGEAPAGVGSTHVVASAGLAYVADTEGDAILVYRLRPRLELADRVELPGAPYGIALDRRRRRLWVTLTGRNELIRLDLAAGGPRREASFPTLRQPNSVTVDERTGSVYVAGRVGSQLQILDGGMCRQPAG